MGNSQDCVRVAGGKMDEEGFGRRSPWKGGGELGKNEKKNGRYLMKNERARIVREELKTKIEKNENARIFTTDI